MVVDHTPNYLFPLNLGRTLPCSLCFCRYYKVPVAMGRKSATGIETKQSHGRSKNSASQKSVVRRSKGEASTVESPVKLPNDWPCRSSSPPRLLNFFETLDDEDDDFGFLGQSDGRSYSSTALKPGPVIQQCSGTDIQLARGAMNVASIKKEKGRYLLLLPGLMSLKTSTQSDSTTNAPAKPASKETSDDAVEENENSEITDMEKDWDKHEDDDAQPSASLAAANNSNAPLLGRLERLNSATPVFRIPFPAESSTEGQDIGSSGGQRMLCFPGTKVETSSKFMILTCKKKQVGGTVKCKVCEDEMHLSHHKLRNPVSLYGHPEIFANPNLPLPHFLLLLISCLHW